MINGRNDSSLTIIWKKITPPLYYRKYIFEEEIIEENVLFEVDIICLNK